MYTLTKAEQETTIRWDAADRTVHIFTADPASIRKLDKLTAQYPDVYRCIWTDDQYPAKRYTIADKRFVRFGKPASEAKQAAMRMIGAKTCFKAKQRRNSRVPDPLAADPYSG